MQKRKLRRDTIFTRLYYGMIKENPTLILCVGFAPTLAVTTTAKNGLAMGIITALVLLLTEFFVSLLKRAIPKKDRTAAYAIISACFATLLQLALDAYYPDYSEALGIFVSLIAVNGLIFSRAENYAVKHNPFLALFDGIGFGIGFTFVITLMGAIRELLGIGTIFGIRVIPDGYTISIAALAPGAFFLLACLIALANKLKGGKRA